MNTVTFQLQQKFIQVFIKLTSADRASRHQCCSSVKGNVAGRKKHNGFLRKNFFLNFNFQLLISILLLGINPWAAGISSESQLGCFCSPSDDELKKREKNRPTHHLHFVNEEHLNARFFFLFFFARAWFFYPELWGPSKKISAMPLGFYLPPVCKEVLPEDFFGGVLMVQHLGKEHRHFLRGQAQLHLLTCRNTSTTATLIFDFVWGSYMLSGLTDLLYMLEQNNKNNNNKKLLNAACPPGSTVWWNCWMR